MGQAAAAPAPRGEGCVAKRPSAVSCWGLVKVRRSLIGVNTDYKMSRGRGVVVH